MLPLKIRRALSFSLIEAIYPGVLLQINIQSEALKTMHKECTLTHFKAHTDILYKKLMTKFPSVDQLA